MQRVCNSQYPATSSVLFLPTICLDPTDMTCIYSTLLFVSKQAKWYGFTPILTFDQPLWWKALNIIQNEPSGSDLQLIVLRLGGFHIEMSFLGCIGHLMAGSSLQELLELVYTKNAVTHILHGLLTPSSNFTPVKVSTSVNKFQLHPSKWNELRITFACSLTEYKLVEIAGCKKIQYR